MHEDQFNSTFTNNSSHPQIIQRDKISIDEVSDDKDLTVFVSNYNSTASNVSPSHSHHFSDGFIQGDNKNIFTKSQGEVHHHRGTSVTFNISVC